MQNISWLVNNYLLCAFFLITGIISAFVNYLFIISIFFIIYFYKKQYNSIILLAYILGIVLATRYKLSESISNLIADRNSTISAQIKNITKNNSFRVDLSKIKINEKVDPKFITKFFYTNFKKIKIGNKVKFNINKKFKFWQNYLYVENHAKTKNIFLVFKNLKKKFDANIKPETKKVCDAIFWGYSTKAQLNELYCLDKLGCQHLMARSGLHLVPINAIFCFSKSKLNLIFSIVILIYYTISSATSYSFLRAIIITVIIYFWQLIGFKINKKLILCQTLIAIIIIWPESIFTASFQLSFALVAALYFLSK
jgi:predicted membrane metal-binding protein